MLAVESMIEFMEMTNDEVFDKFYKPHPAVNVVSSVVFKTTFPRYMYIPGTRGDRVLLVGHVDTVWGDAKIKVAEQNGVLYSATLESHLGKRKANDGEGYWSDAVGIGADDRVGVAMLYELQKSGHSILLNEYEEISLGHHINARDPWLSQQVLTHKFAIEFDRHGESDLIYYNNESETFKNYIQKNYREYKEAQGFGSDIAAFCMKKIPAVNISVGYYREHTPSERVVVDQAQRTFNLTQKFLEKEQSSWYM